VIVELSRDMLLADRRLGNATLHFLLAKVGQLLKVVQPRAA
jgi:hypothetical protein